MGPLRGSGGHLFVLLSILKNVLPELPTSVEGQKKKDNEIFIPASFYVSCGLNRPEKYGCYVRCLNEVIRRLFCEMSPCRHVSS
jgi:hypothetical protein